MQTTKTASTFLCSIAGSGKGLIFTPLIFPRPRLITLWSAYSSAISIATNLYTGHGFVASGGQTGIALGFWGIGLSFAIPGEPAFFGFGGFFGNLPRLPPSPKAPPTTKPATTIAPITIYQIAPCIAAKMEGITPLCPATTTIAV